VTLRADCHNVFAMAEMMQDGKRLEGDFSEVIGRRWMRRPRTPLGSRVWR
jgi:hypothetical protein